MNDFSFLIKKASDALCGSYSPYSEYRVGAALLTADGKIFTGANVENASYGATICAERVAITSAISAGERKFTAIAIVGGKNGNLSDFAYPCGVCLQVMNEFCDSDFRIILAKDGEAKILTLGELLPNGFKL